MSDSRTGRLRLPPLRVLLRRFPGAKPSLTWRRGGIKAPQGKDRWKFLMEMMQQRMGKGDGGADLPLPLSSPTSRGTTRANSSLFHAPDNSQPPPSTHPTGASHTTGNQLSKRKGDAGCHPTSPNPLPKAGEQQGRAEEPPEPPSPSVLPREWELIYLWLLLFLRSSAGGGSRGWAGKEEEAEARKSRSGC